MRRLAIPEAWNKVIKMSSATYLRFSKSLSKDTRYQAQVETKLLIEGMRGDGINDIKRIVCP